MWTALHYDLDEGEQADIVHWIPAHTSEEQVGSLICSDGTVLTGTMRCANEMVDRLAKQAAQTIAMSTAMRSGLKRRYNQARELAVLVGKLTYAAGHCDRGDGKCCRDSVGMCAAAARRRPVPSARKTMPEVVASMAPEALEGRSQTVASVLQRIRSKWAAAQEPPPAS